MLRTEQRIFPHDAELVRGNVVQKHIDAAEIVGRQVDFLPVESVVDVLPAQHLRHFQQQRARTAGGVIDLVDARFADGAKACQQLRNIRRGEILPALFARIGGVHAHQVLIGIAEQIGIHAIGGEQWHLRHTVQQLHQHLVPLGDGFADGLAVHVEIIKQTGEVAFRLAAGSAAFDVVEYPFQRFVQVLVLIRAGEDVAEQFRGQDEEALYQYQIFTSSFCLVVGQLGIGKIMVASFVFTLVNICREVLRNVAVEHRPQHIRLEIPLRHMPRVDKVGSDFVDSAEQLVPLLLVLSVSHRCCSFKAIHAVSISVKPFSIQKTNSIIAYIYHFHNAA